MELITVSVLLILVGASLGPITRFLEDREARKLQEEWRRKEAESNKAIGFALTRPPEPPPEPEPQGWKLLIAFTILVVLFAILTAILNWPYIREHYEDGMFFGWLFLTMVFGVIVRVVTDNRQQGQHLFRVRASDILYPLLFAIVIFYPVWGIATSAPRNFFAFYGAFLNGFFWQNVVAAAKPPK